MIENRVTVQNQEQWEELLIELFGKRSVDVPAPTTFPFFFCPSRCGDHTLVLIAKGHGPTHILDITEAHAAIIQVVTEPINVNRFTPGSIEGVVFTGSRKLMQGDARGWLAEVARSDEDGGVSMVYTSMTEPGVIRGPHEHHSQTDRFLFIGEATIWLWDNRASSPTFNHRHKYVVPNTIGKLVIPPGIVHAYRNDARISRMIVVNAPDQLYKGRARQEPVDEMRYEDDPENKFQPW